MSVTARTTGRAGSGSNEEVYSWEVIASRLASPITFPVPVEVHLLRHGQTPTNARGVVTGSTDVPLTAEGMWQARRAGRQLAGSYDLVFHSRLRRTVHTLRLARQVSKVRYGRVLGDSRLRERSLGVLQQSRAPSVVIPAYAAGDLTFAPEGGESYAEVARRVLSFLLDLAGWVLAVHPERVLVCSHAGPMRVLLGVFDSAADPSVVLAPLYLNATIIRREWRELRLPPFLDGVTPQFYNCHDSPTVVLPASTS